MSRLPPAARALARRLLAASAVLGGTVTHVATRRPLAALTFDDGPNPQATPQLLEILERHGARATFFMVGKAAARHPELVARVAAGGHAVGNHSWDHPSLPLLRRRGRRAQIRWCGEALAPHGTALLRPPYGHQSLASRFDAWRLGYRVVAWSAMAEDWLDDPADRLLERLDDQVVPGAIVLFHDALYTTTAERYRDRAPTLEAVDRLLAEHTGRLSFVTVPELLAAGRPRRWPWYKRADLDWLRQLV